MKAATISKMKYNKSAYKRYEFNVRADSRLNGIIERYKKIPGANLSELIKSCLCLHFGLERAEAEFICVPYRFGNNGEHIANHELDKYFPGDLK